MRRSVRRVLAVLCLLLLISAAWTVFEPHRQLTEQGSDYFVSEDISPSVQWSHARLNTKQVPHTMVVRKYAPAGNETLFSKRIYQYDPQSRHVRTTLYYRGDGEWSTSHLYFGEHVKADAIGTVASPTDTTVTELSVLSTDPQYNAFVRARTDYLDGQVAKYKLETLNTTSNYLVVGVQTAEDYADFRQLDDERIRNGSSYRAFIDRETGRVVKVIETRRYREPDNETQSVRTVIRFRNYGNTSVSRPSWVGWDPMEIVYDALSL